MALNKPDNIAKLEDILASDDPKINFDDIDAFGRKEVSKDQMMQLMTTQPHFPIIPVDGKCLLLAAATKKSRALIWLSSCFEVVSAYFDSKNIYRVQLQINGHLVEVDYDSLYPKNIIKLSRYGLIINFDYAESLSRYIFKRIAGLEVKERINGMGFIMQDGTPTFRAYNENPELLKYTEDTDMTDYITGINSLLTNTAIMFALCCACASLFLAFLGIVCGLPIMSFVISFYGKTTTGKSTAQTLMASVFSDPKDRSVYRPFYATENALMKMISRRFGVPQLFDEATVSTGLNVGKLLYAIASENDKGRCGSDAELRESGPWKLIVITSSENKLLPDSQMHNHGLDTRILSFNLRFTDSSEHSDQIHAFCGKHYGVLGKALSEYLLSADPDKITAMYNDCRDTMRSAVDKDSAFDLEDRLNKEYATILLAARVLADYRINIDIEGITAILTENYNSVRETTDIAEKYYQHLVNYLALHPYADGIKKDEETNTVAYIDELFLRVLESYGASNSDLVIHELDKAGYISRPTGRGLKKRRRINGPLTNCYEIYLPPVDSESDEGGMTLEYILTHYEGLDES